MSAVSNGQLAYAIWREHTPPIGNTAVPPEWDNISTTERERWECLGEVMYNSMKFGVLISLCLGDGLADALAAAVEKAKQEKTTPDDDGRPRIWVNEEETIIAFLYDNTRLDIATRQRNGDTWGPPIATTEKKWS